MIEVSRIRQIELELEASCRVEDYRGYCKFDALNSQTLEDFFGGHSIGRLLVTQAVNRIPLPLREIFGVKKARNPMGVANFIRGYWAMRSRLPESVGRAIGLSDWLLTQTCQQLGTWKGEGVAWGYQFPWQSPGFFAPRHAPNCYVTVMCAEALLESYKITSDEKYLSAVLGAAEFVTRSLPRLLESEDQLCIGYVPDGPKWKVININALAAGFLVKLVDQRQDVLPICRKLLRWTDSVRNSNLSWNYTEPFEQSGIGPDNYHTGFILDGFFDASSQLSEFEETYWSGLEFYRKNLFSKEMAPKWRDNQDYPHDIHGAAQGVLTFLKAASKKPEYLVAAQGCLNWALTKMYDQNQRYFYYQEHRNFVWKLNLMRWNNSWMQLAISSYLTATGER